MKFFSRISNVFFGASILTWDVLLTLGNFIRPSRRVGEVIPHGHPGHGGYWPEYRPPQKDDSRCCCPAFNLMANHGILPRSGRGIRFTDASKYIASTFNLSPSFCYYACRFMASMLKRNYSMDAFDLEELNLHNGVEHDASLTRLDTALQPNQAVPHTALVEEIFSFATGKDATGNRLITMKDLSRMLSKRRVESRAANKEYSLSFAHKVFASSNASLLVTIFGGRVDDLRVILLDERFPERWESRVCKHHGLTILGHNSVALPIEFGVREADWISDERQVAAANQEAVVPDT